MKKICRRYKLWKNWCKHCSNSGLYKIFVLFGITHSPTFECYVTCREELDRQIRTYKERDIDDTASEMSETMKKIKLAYKIGYEDGIKHERCAIKKALFSRSIGLRRKKRD